MLAHSLPLPIGGTISSDMVPQCPLAKEMIRRFRSQFTSAVGAEGDGDEVYQMNMNFFQLTESPAIKMVEDEGVDTEETKKL